MAVSITTTGCRRYEPCPDEGPRPEGLTSQDLAGIYSDSGRLITLNSDGTLSTIGWPEDRDGEPGDSERQIGVGTWQLTDEAEEFGFPVALSFDEISDLRDSGSSGGTYSSGLYVSGSREEPHLYEFVGDPDNCRINTFRRP
ncbi:hypothetical protein [Streptomyces corynorhini]|uniref:hypothetical protein n=1 Tax=Streptomyces corynorhini TaxID=2282652 RepID=UPI001F1DF67E|nr:hypothetical protein [Streptomyces corynorhini]